MKAYLKQIRISPKKVSLVAAMVCGKPVAEALRILKFTLKRSAPVVAKLIASAIANAENNFKQDPEKLFILKITVNGGTILKRGRPISRGRWHPIKKRTSHITVELEIENAKGKMQKKEPIKKAEAEKTKDVEPSKKVEKNEDTSSQENKVNSEKPVKEAPNLKKEQDSKK